MTVFPTNADFTARDTTAILARLDRSIQSVFPQWSDRAIADFGNILLASLAWVGDVKGLYQDAQAREAFLSTATQLVNMLRHARRNAYIPREPTAGTADLVITLDVPAVLDVPIPAGSIIRSKSATDPLRYQILAAGLIPAGLQTLTISAENSETKIEVFESDESKDLEIILEFTPFLNIASLDDSTGPWTLPPVATFLDASANDKVIRQFRNDRDQGLARFGDGLNGRIPVGDITILYKVGGGAVFAEAGSLEVPEFTLVDINSNTVGFSVTNPSPAIPGTR